MLRQIALIWRPPHKPSLTLCNAQLKPEQRSEKSRPISAEAQRICRCLRKPDARGDSVRPRADKSFT